MCPCFADSLTGPVLRLADLRFVGVLDDGPAKVRSTSLTCPCTWCAPGHTIDSLYDTLRAHAQRLTWGITLWAIQDSNL